MSRHVRGQKWSRPVLIKVCLVSGEIVKDENGVGERKKEPEFETEIKLSSCPLVQCCFLSSVIFQNLPSA